MAPSSSPWPLSSTAAVEDCSALAAVCCMTAPGLGREPGRDQRQGPPVGRDEAAPRAEVGRAGGHRGRGMATGMMAASSAAPGAPLSRLDGPGGRLATVAGKLPESAGMPYRPNTRARRSGRSVTIPSTPAARRARISASSSTAQAWTGIRSEWK